MRVAAMMRAAAGVYKIPVACQVQPSFDCSKDTFWLDRPGWPASGRDARRRVKWELSRVNPGDDPTLRKGGVIMDNLGSHKVKGVCEAIEAAGASFIVHPTL